MLFSQQLRRGAVRWTDGDAPGLPSRRDPGGGEAVASRIKELKTRALRGDDEAIDDLACNLPGERLALFHLDGRRKRGVCTSARFARDLAIRNHPKAREVLINAWSQCHFTTIVSLGGLRRCVKLFQRIRPYDPHIPLLGDRLTVWRGHLADNPGFGISWTTDPAMARWFVEEYWTGRFGVTGESVVIQREVARDEVLAIVGPDEGREGGAEVLLRPSG